MANLRVDKITSTETFEKTGSVQFDGNSDWLDIASSNDFAYGTGDFTWEAWFYPAAVKTTHYIFDHGNDGGVIQFYDGIIRYYNSTIGVNSILYTGGGTLNYSSWSHIAVSRNSGISRLFVNGQLKCFGSDTHSYSAQAVTIGDYGANSGTNKAQGFISNARLVKGTALYTSNFKPSMRELEVTAETVLLACQSKTDATLEKTGKTITANGNAVASELTPGILTPIVKSGGGSAITGSVEFTGSSTLEVRSPDFAMGDSDLTMECWFYNGVDTITHMVQIDVEGGATNFSLATRDAAAGDVRFLVRNDSSSNLSDLVAGAPRAKINMWHHLAGTIEGTTTRLFLNGVLIKSGTISGTRTHTGDKLTLGANEGNRYLKGYLSNVRIVRGTALYTDNFIPPTRELKKVPGTVLLACQDPDSALTEATGKTITGHGDLSRTDIGVDLVTNGDFTSNTTGWTAVNGNTTLSVDTTVNPGKSVLKILGGGSGDYPAARQTITGLDIGGDYEVSFVFTKDGHNLQSMIRTDTTDSYGTIGVQVANLTTEPTYDATFRYIFRALASTMYLNFHAWGSASAVAYVDNVKVYKLDPGNRASNFTPQVGDDRQITFEGVTKINSDAYFYLPTGDTVTRDSRSGRGLFMGGYTNVPSGTAVNIINYITISTFGNANDFGDLTNAARWAGGSCGSSTRGLYGGGATPTSTDHIDFVTIATTSNAIDFGNLATAQGYVKACSNQTRGIWGGGRTSPTVSSDVVQYITIASTGNGVDFGNLTSARTGIAGFASPIRGIFSGGYTHPSPTTIATMDYITIASTGNALDFGDLLTIVKYSDAVSSGTRGAIGGGAYPANTNVIQYVTISTRGNAQDFGDLVVTREHISGTDNSTRGVFAGGATPTLTNNMDYITIASTGDAKDFGDLPGVKPAYAGGTSDSHGGLG